MKAPNKIFAGMAAGHLYARLTPTKLFDEEFSEYIRKDLLLEWAKEQSASCDGSVAMKRAYDKLIDKLNSL